MNGTDFSVFSGLMVRTDPHMVDVTYETVDRTWTERLFSWPWRPLQKTKTIQHATPKKEAYQLPNGIMVMHPEALRALREAIDNQ